MPPGLDTVVPHEFVSTAVDATGHFITLPPGQLQRGDNRRHLGEDIKLGQTALQKGELLTPAALGLAASLGIETVTVLRQIKVAYFSTGDEILSLGEPPRAGAVYDSNRYTLLGLLTRLGVQVIDLGPVRDEPAALQAALAHAALVADAVITSAGVSAGDADHTRATLQGLTGDGEDPQGGIVFWQLAMRPGRPLAAGRLLRQRAISSLKSALSPSAASIVSYQNYSDSGATMVFGLPGNPVAAMTSFLMLVRPALLTMMGCTRRQPPPLQAHCASAIRKKPGRTEYLRGIVSHAADGSLQVQLTGNQGSGILSAMSQANGLIVLPHDQGNVATGQPVAVMMFDGLI
jgi:molybdopterin molybdotransferase